MWNLTGDNAISKPKRSLLPVLTVLFLVSYGLLTMLVVEQGRTIDSQRNLIRMLFDDSIQLNSLRGKENQRQQAEARAKSQLKSPAAQSAPRDPQAQTPSTQTPSNQNPPPQTPRADAKNRSTSKFRRPLPQKPPKATAEEGDERRALISI